MPKRDGTGPDGKGPKTGRGKGDCSRSGGLRRKRVGRVRKNRKK